MTDHQGFHKDMIARGSFPKGERPEPYQEYYYVDKWVPAERDIVKRTEIMDFNPQPGERVVEIGCQTGGFMQYAWLKGCRDVNGIDYDADYIDLAQKLNKINNFDISYQVGSALDESLLTKLAEGKRIDHLLLMSMGKHIGERQLFHIVDKLNAKKTYIETNAVGSNKFPYKAQLEARGGAVVGITTDRNTRYVYLISKK